MQQQSDDEDRPELSDCSDADKDSDFESVRNSQKYKYSETTKLKKIKNKQTGKHGAEQLKQSRFGKFVRNKNSKFFSANSVFYVLTCMNRYVSISVSINNIILH